MNINSTALKKNKLLVIGGIFLVVITGLLVYFSNKKNKQIT